MAIKLKCLLQLAFLSQRHKDQTAGKPSKQEVLTIRTRIFMLLIIASALFAYKSFQPQIPKPPAAGKDYIIIEKTNNKLYLYKDGKFVKSYRVATGKEPHFTPEGTFKIANKSDLTAQEMPSRFGTRWIGLAVPLHKDLKEPDDRAPRGEKYGIHGTDEPSSIGKHASSGCIRLRNRDVEELYDQVQIGTEVEIRP